jgi:hypothetical protein
MNRTLALLLAWTSPGFFSWGEGGFFYLVCEAIGHSWPIVPASGDNEDDCGEADGM